MDQHKPAHRRHAVTVEGAGDKLIVFAHGYGCDQSVWRRLQPAFTKMARTLTFDMTEAGESDLEHFDPHSRHSELSGYAADLLDICGELDDEQITFVGHSVGAIIGLIAASQQPSLFRELILIAPSPMYLNEGTYRGGFEAEQLEALLDVMDANFVDWAKTVSPHIMGTGKPELAAELAESFCRWDREMARHFARLTFQSDSRGILPAVTNDCLIIQCAKDDIAPASVGAFMLEQLPGATLIELQTEGHCPHVSHSDETIKVIWTTSRPAESRSPMRHNQKASHDLAEAAPVGLGFTGQAGIPSILIGRNDCQSFLLNPKLFRSAVSCVARGESLSRSS